MYVVIVHIAIEQGFLLSVRELAFICLCAYISKTETNVGIQSASMYLFVTQVLCGVYDLLIRALTIVFVLTVMKAR